MTGDVLDPTGGQTELHAGAEQMEEERPKTAYLVALGIIPGDRQHVSGWIRLLAYCVAGVPFDRAGAIF